MIARQYHSTGPTTDMVERGKHNLGQLARESYGAGDVALVGYDRPPAPRGAKLARIWSQ